MPKMSFNTAKLVSGINRYARVGIAWSAQETDNGFYLSFPSLESRDSIV